MRERGMGKVELVTYLKERKEERNERVRNG